MPIGLEAGIQDPYLLVYRQREYQDECTGHTAGKSDNIVKIHAWVLQMTAGEGSQWRYVMTDEVVTLRKPWSVANWMLLLISKRHFGAISVSPTQNTVSD